MKILSIASLIIALVALALAGTAYYRPAPASAIPAAVTLSSQPSKDLGLSFISLDLDSGGCSVNTKTDSSHANKGKNAHWMILNSCIPTSPHTSIIVELKDFTLNGQANNPFDSAVSITMTSAGLFVLKAHVRSNADKGTYSFSVYVDGVKQADPDIVIDN